MEKQNIFSEKHALLVSTQEPGIAQEHIANMKVDRWQRMVICGVMLALFIWLNLEIIWMIQAAIPIDIEMVKAKLIHPDERVINAKVYIALIAGTVSEVATLLIVIANYLFPKNNR